MNTGPLVILSACKHGAGRSQIAAAVIEAASRGTGPCSAYARIGPVNVLVGGTQPKPPPYPVPASIVTILAELGLAPLFTHTRSIQPSDVASADAIICFAEQSTWPDYLAQAGTLTTYQVVDGAGQTIEFQRAMRDEVIAHVASFLEHTISLHRELAPGS
jgi:protein-tyrosine-phosphatase